MVLYDIKTFDKQVRKLATGQRLKKYLEVLPGLDTDLLFRKYPKIILMDIRKFEERVDALRNFLGGGDMAKAISSAPDILLSDIELCLQPRLTRLVSALQGVINADEVRSMVIQCPQVLLSDVRNVIVPGLRFMLRCCSDAVTLGRRLYRDPALLLALSGTGPLARLQFTLEQYQNGTIVMDVGTTSENEKSCVGPTRGSNVTSVTVGVKDIPIGAPQVVSSEDLTRLPEVTGAGGNSTQFNSTRGVRGLHESNNRLLPAVLFPQCIKCTTRDFVWRNPAYVAYLMERQGLGKAGGGVKVDEGQIVSWERAVGARLSAKYRPGVTPYAKAKMAKGPRGQKVPLSELDLLVGDVLHVNKRISEVFRTQMLSRKEAVYLRQEIGKLAEDMEWGRRQ
ncbi:unnamed protein product, partial [Choristocarpus tenellus]